LDNLMDKTSFLVVTPSSFIFFFYSKNKKLFILSHNCMLDLPLFYQEQNVSLILGIRRNIIASSAKEKDLKYLVGD